MKRSIVLACMLIGVPAAGQSMNLDYGDEAGGPAGGYGAAGLPGVWNVLVEEPGVPETLVNLAGRPVDATVSYDLVAALSFDDPATGGDDERLLDDGLGGVGDVMLHVSFEGLMNGTYEIITYAWTPGLGIDQTLIVIDDDVINGLVAGGPWPGALQEGVTHVVHEATVTSGTLSIGVVGGYFGAGGFVNGIQLRRITAADLDGDGIVGILDFLELVASWGPCPPPQECPADLDGDQLIGIEDFLMLLADWG